VSTIEPLGGHNTEVFQIDLVTPLETDLWLQSQDRARGISYIPKGISRLVFRHTNPVAGLNEEYQIQNSVAIMSLARQALSSFPQRLVPLVFAWQDKAAAFPGWAVTEFVEGHNIAEEFHNMDVQNQDKVLTQVTQVLKGLQEFKLPTKHFGGIGFDESGNFIGRPMNLPCGGPFNSYGELCRGMLDWQANARAASEYLSANDELSIVERVIEMRDGVSIVSI
jgi:hypothetical protein